MTAFKFRRNLNRLTASALLSACLALPCQPALAEAAPPGDLWKLACDHKNTHRISTLFTAQDVRRYLANPEDVASAIEWCKKTGITQVYLESFRDGYRADREQLLNAKRAFVEAGLGVSGCVTPTKVGKASTGWKEVISCYTAPATQTNVLRIFEYAAELFDETMIDDFWFTDCACPECDAARNAKTATVYGRNYRVKGDSWEDYRCELMVRLSRDLVLAAAKRVNPKATFIIKFPQWYDRFHERGYEVLRQTADFDKIWVGTETRDYSDRRWGGTPQYEAYFIMRWLGGLGGEKCGGGWFDPFGTTEKTYVEQARQTVLGGARESLLFAYGALQRETGPGNIEAFRAHLPELLAVAGEVKKRPIIGVAAYKPVNSHPEKEPRVFDFVGMLGIPLIPGHEFPSAEPSAFFSMHALKDPGFVEKLKRFISQGKPVLLTDGLSAELCNRVNLRVPNVRVLPVKQDPKNLLTMPQTELDSIRQQILSPLKTSFKAPSQVALYLFKDGSSVIENFTEAPADVELNGRALTVSPRGWVCEWR